MSNAESAVDMDVTGTTTAKVRLCIVARLDVYLVERELVVEAFNVTRDIAFDFLCRSTRYLRGATSPSGSPWAEELYDSRLDGW